MGGATSIEVGAQYSDKVGVIGTVSDYHHGRKNLVSRQFRNDKKCLSQICIKQHKEVMRARKATKENKDAAGVGGE